MIAIDPRKTYKFSVWIKSTDQSMDNLFGFQLFNSNGYAIGGVWQNQYFKTSEKDENSWKQWWAYLLPSNAGRGNCDRIETNGIDYCNSPDARYVNFRLRSCYGDGNGLGTTYYMYPRIEEV